MYVFLWKQLENHDDDTTGYTENMFGLTEKESGILRKLPTPAKIQDFLNEIPFNFEKKGNTHYSPRMVLKAGKAHCIEGALLAAAALMVNGEPPLLMDLKSARGDDDHVVALYRRNGYWGALSKTNHAVLRFRDPVYKTPRELALSYFHEWFMNEDGRKTLRSFSKPLNMKRFGTEWVTSEKPLFWLDRELNALPHFPIAPKENMKRLRAADAIERRAGSIVEWKRKDTE